MYQPRLPTIFEEPVTFQSHGTTFFVQTPSCLAYGTSLNASHLAATEAIPLHEHDFREPSTSTRPKKILTITAPPQERTRKEAKATKQTEEKSVEKEPSELMRQFLTEKTHPLRNRWSIWYFKQDKEKKWEDCFWKIATVDSVEDFYGTFLHILRPSELPMGNDYYMFKDTIKPMWEDEANTHGGRWLIMVDRNQRMRLLDEYWEKLLAAMIGNRFGEESESTCGAVVNVRQKGDKISLWTTDSRANRVNEAIGTIIKEELGIRSQIRYEMHRDVKEKSGSVARPMIIL